MFSFLDNTPCGENEEVNSDLLAVAKAMDDINSVFDLSEQEILDFQGALESLKAIFANGDFPENHFPVLAYGMFKECYELGSTNRFIIKFCANDNENLQEMYILDKAKENNVEQFFLPTWGIPITSTLIPASYVDSEDYTYEAVINSSGYTSYRRNYTRAEDFGLSYIMIQPRISLIVDLDSENQNCKVDSEILYKDKTYNAEDLVDRAIRSYTWLYHCVNNYGIRAMKRLRKFIIDYRLDDLHNANIGYLDKDKTKPIIIDWLSRGKTSN